MSVITSGIEQSLDYLHRALVETLDNNSPKEIIFLIV